MTEALKSTPVTNLDATPVVMATSGEGLPAFAKIATDSVAATAQVGVVGSTYRLCRIPTNAKIKRVWLYTQGLDTNAAATLTLDINLAFSDSANDGTNINNQGAIPTSANTGNTTTVAAYAAPNKLFGAGIATLNAGAYQNRDITFAGSFTPANRDDDIWDVFGFVNAQGYGQDPGGFFDFLVYSAHVAATAAAGTIGIECDYAV